MGSSVNNTVLDIFCSLFFVRHLCTLKQQQKAHQLPGRGKLRHRPSSQCPTRAPASAGRQNHPRLPRLLSLCPAVHRHLQPEHFAALPPPDVAVAAAAAAGKGGGRAAVHLHADYGELHQPLPPPLLRLDPKLVWSKILVLFVLIAVVSPSCARVPCTADPPERRRRMLPLLHRHRGCCCCCCSKAP